MKDVKKELALKSRQESMILHRLKLKISEKNTIYCVVEGKDDAPYYYPKIDSFAAGKSIEFINVSGRDNVIKSHTISRKTTSLKNYITLFFVDKDFNNDKLPLDIYQTSTYSIENYYVKPNVLKKILTYTWNIDLDIISNIINQYSEVQKMYHHHALEMNAFIKMQQCKDRKGNIRLNLNQINLSDIYKINLDSVILKANINTWIKQVSNYLEYSNDEIEFYKNSFTYSNFSESFRGKNELFFFREYLKLIKDELGRKNNFFGKKFKITGNIDEIISTFAQYAEFPNCLKDYLRRMLINKDMVSSIKIG